MNCWILDSIVRNLSKFHAVNSPKWSDKIARAHVVRAHITILFVSLSFFADSSPSLARALLFLCVWTARFLPEYNKFILSPFFFSLSYPIIRRYTPFILWISRSTFVNVDLVPLLPLLFFAWSNASSEKKIHYFIPPCACWSVSWIFQISLDHPHNREQRERAIMTPASDGFVTLQNFPHFTFYRLSSAMFV